MSQLFTAQSRFRDRFILGITFVLNNNNSTADDAFKIVFVSLNRLVVEENERKVAKPNQQHPGNSYRYDERVPTVSNSVPANYNGEEGAGDYCLATRNTKTLPLRGENFRARYEEKISEENRLTTTALVERPPYKFNKEEFMERRRHFEEQPPPLPPVDTPDDAGTPKDFQNYRYMYNSIGSDSKERPLRVQLPDEKKKDSTETNQSTEDLLSTKNSEQSSANTMNKSDKVSNSDEVSQNENETKEGECLVNCLYYTQQICDCSIL